MVKSPRARISAIDDIEIYIAFSCCRVVSGRNKNPSSWPNCILIGRVLLRHLVNDLVGVAVGIRGKVKGVFDDGLCRIRRLVEQVVDFQDQAAVADHGPTPSAIRVRAVENGVAKHPKKSFPVGRKLDARASVLPDNISTFSRFHVEIRRRADVGVDSIPGSDERWTIKGDEKYCNGGQKQKKDR